jgi:WD40 repeat protein
MQTFTCVKNQYWGGDPGLWVAAEDGMVYRHLESDISYTAIDNEGDLVATGDEVGKVTLYTSDLDPTPLGSHRSIVTGVSIRNAQIVSCSSDHAAILWDGSTQSMASKYTASGWDLLTCEWHPTQPLVLLGGKDNVIRIWDTRTLKQAQEVRGHRNTIMVARWNKDNDGATFCSGGRDRTLRVWSASNTSIPLQIEQGLSEVMSAEWCGERGLVFGTRGEGVRRVGDIMPVFQVNEVSSISYNSDTHRLSMANKTPEMLIATLTLGQVDEFET